MYQLFREQAVNIKFHIASETIDDPYEKTVTLTYLPPLPVKAIVQDLSFSKLQWIMPGIRADKAKEIYIEKKRESLLKAGFYITIGNDSTKYEGYLENGTLKYKEEGEYLRLYVYSRVD